MECLHRHRRGAVFPGVQPAAPEPSLRPHGRFIARYVPELAELDDKTIHEPGKQPLLCPDYPAPIVAHQGVKQRVEQAFRQARDAWRQQQEGGQ